MKPRNATDSFAPRNRGSVPAAATIASIAARTFWHGSPGITPTRTLNVARVATLLVHSPPSIVPRLTLIGWFAPAKAGCRRSPRLAWSS